MAAEAPSINKLPGTSYGGVAKYGGAYAKIELMIKNGMIDISKDGMIAQCVSRQRTADGDQLLITYSIKNGELVEHFGTLGKDVSHDPQLAQDAKGGYAYQPFDEKDGITKTAPGDPMWTIATFVDGEANVRCYFCRYKGGQTGATAYANKIYRCTKVWSGYAVKQCAVVAGRHRINVTLSAPVSAAAAAPV